MVRTSVISFAALATVAVVIANPHDYHGNDNVNDDNSFKTMVMQQMGMLNAKLNTLTQRLQQKDQENDQLKKQLLRQSSKRQTVDEVAFSASLSSHVTNLSPHQGIVFGNVLTNSGNFYEKTTGIFHVPVSGMYLFFVNILSEADNNIETELMVDGHVAAEIYSGAAKFNGAGSNLVIMYVSSGKNVWVKVHAAYSTNMAIHCCWSTFSGYLLRGDSSSPIVG